VKQLPGDLCKGSALVVPFPTFRFVLSSFYLFYVPPYPVVVFDDAAPAEAWILQRMKNQGMPIPSDSGR
jgi:hypothetical protein